MPRFIFLLIVLAGLAFREVAMELRPSFLRPGLHLFAYVGNTAEGTLTVVDLVKLSAVTTIPVGLGRAGCARIPPGMKSGASVLSAVTPGSSTPS